MLKVSFALLVAFVAGVSLIGAALPVLYAQPLPPPASSPAPPGAPPPQPTAGLPSYDRPVRFYCVQGFRCINHLRHFCASRPRFAAPGRPRHCVCEPSQPLRAC
jgi:hypothetical protein